MATNRKPRYFFAVFGEPDAERAGVESGRYSHKGYISNLGMVPGHVLLLYCTFGYPEHRMEAPGIGIVIGTTEECVYYQYFPLERPVGWYTIEVNLRNYENRLKNLSLKGNWLFEIDKVSFRKALEGTRVDWP